MLKGVGLNPFGYTHHTDHLAVVCVIMDIPLLFTEENDCLAAKKHYPQLNTQHVSWEHFSPEYIISHYDAIFTSELWGKKRLFDHFARYEQKYQKKLRHIHCPHGFSDKGFWLEQCAFEDITLIYGNNMLDLLKERGVYEHLQHYVITGNYRYTYYRQHREFFEELFEKDILIRFKKQQPILLYAPTWRDQENSTSFFTATTHLLDKLPENYNMIVKLHPNLEEDDPGLFYHMIAKYEESPHIVFLEKYSLVYPLLAHADAYIGDMSSIGYDYLAFNRPMFFFNEQNRNATNDRGLYLFRCGIEIKPVQYEHFFEILEKHLSNDRETFSQIRADVYRYTFGAEKSFEEIKADILLKATQ